MSTVKNMYSGSPSVGWVKNAFSSQTEKIMLETTFSHYLGQKHIRKIKIEKFHAFFHLVQAVQSFTT